MFKIQTQWIYKLIPSTSDNYKTFYTLFMFRATSYSLRLTFDYIFNTLFTS